MLGLAGHMNARQLLWRDQPPQLLWAPPWGRAMIGQLQLFWEMREALRLISSILFSLDI